MNTEIDKEVLRLGHEHNLSLHGSDGSCLHVHWGRVWVTRDGDAKDYIVDAGQSLAINRIGTTLVSAMSDAGLSILQRCTGEQQRVPIESVSFAERGGDGGHDANGAFDIVFPSVGEIDRHVAMAKQLRAHYFAGVLHRAWRAVRRIFMAPSGA